MSADEGYVDPEEITRAVQQIVRAWGAAQNKWLMQRTATGEFGNGLVERVAIYCSARLYARAFRLDGLLTDAELLTLEDFLDSCSVKTGSIDDMGTLPTQADGKA